jgi:hypothetical protein
MRFVYNDPYALRGAVEQLAGQQPVGTRRERDLPIPVDVYAELTDPTSRILVEKPEVVDAVKGQGYREVGVKSNRRKGRSK